MTPVDLAKIASYRAPDREYIIDDRWYKEVDSSGQAYPICYAHDKTAFIEYVQEALAVGVVE